LEYENKPKAAARLSSAALTADMMDRDRFCRVFKGPDSATLYQRGKADPAVIKPALKMSADFFSHLSI